MGFLNVSTVFDYDSSVMSKKLTSYSCFKKKKFIFVDMDFVHSMSILLLNTIWFSFFDYMMWRFWYMFSQCCLFFPWFHSFVNNMLSIVFIWFSTICKWFFKCVSQIIDFCPILSSVIIRVVEKWFVQKSMLHFQHEFVSWV